MNDNIPQLRTVGVIAAELGAPIDQVKRLLQKHNVRPVGRAGSLRVFDLNAVEVVRKALRTAGYIGQAVPA